LLFRNRKRRRSVEDIFQLKDDFQNLLLVVLKCPSGTF
jgi:hypothetical protein